MKTAVQRITEPPAKRPRRGLLKTIVYEPTPLCLFIRDEKIVRLGQGGLDMWRCYSTDGLHPRQRFPYWSDVVCDAFVELDCRGARPDFHGQLKCATLADLTIAVAKTDAHEGVRSTRQIARARDDLLLLTVQTSGSTVLTQDGRDVLLRDGDFAIYDTQRPYTLNLSAGTGMICMNLPRVAIKTRLIDLEPYVAVSVSSQIGIGNFTSHVIRALPEHLQEFDACTGSLVAEQVLDLITLSLGHSTGRKTELSSTRALTLRRLKATISRHLHQADLKPAKIAALTGMSIRHANRLLAEEGTSLGRLILEMRLERCRMVLTDASRGGLSVTAVAFGAGFNDMAHFSRTFRARFGLSPRKYRRQSR